MLVITVSFFPGLRFEAAVLEWLRTAIPNTREDDKDASVQKAQCQLILQYITCEINAIIKLIVIFENMNLVCTCALTHQVSGSSPDRTPSPGWRSLSRLFGFAAFNLDGLGFFTAIFLFDGLFVAVRTLVVLL